ncbi:uncharacterized protein LOC143232675 isoform X2 [Tachypleus tridentatus]|uniref:uncharacterized protein LOC143232675 isoform X2 n=1 Tax=Tachypleus tridentatus TaxID=6853 RepID=UPI003FD35269
MKTTPCSCKPEANGNVSCLHPFSCHGDRIPASLHSSDVLPVAQTMGVPETTSSMSLEQISNNSQSLDQTNDDSDDVTRDKYDDVSRSGESCFQDSGDYQWCVDDECNRELNISLTIDPHNINSLSPDQDSLHYDDISKTLDASLAEIDMETFRSEDINSLLTLPGVYSIGSEIEGCSQGENCASLSASLLKDFELERSVSSHNLSEDESVEGSICKDEPLFSPTKEPLNVNSISVDSLDCTSFDEHNIAVTCLAKKSNYTIAFEGSGTHLSENVDSIDAKQNKENIPRPAMIPEYPQNQKVYNNSLVQSDVSYTSWRNLKNNKSAIRSALSTKYQHFRSKSLPNLLKKPLELAEKHSGGRELKINPGKYVHIYELHNSYAGSHQGIKVKENKNSVPLFKLFIKNKSSLATEKFSLSESSSRSGSLENIVPYHIIYSNDTILKTETNEHKDKTDLSFKTLKLERNCDNNKDNFISSSNNEKAPQTTLFKQRQAAKLGKHIMNTNAVELNNNLIHTNAIHKNPMINVNNTVDVINRKETSTGSNESSSQGFEDSLVEGPLTQPTHTHSSTIREDEELLDTDSSSGDERMRDSKDPFGSDGSMSEEASVPQNNVIENKYVIIRPVDESKTVQRIKNILHVENAEKTSVNNTCVTNDGNRLSEKSTEMNLESTSQGTQTKAVNGKTNISAYLCRDKNSTEPLSGLEEVLNNNRQSHKSRETSPASSGYGGSRQNSMERLRHSSQTFINNSNYSSSSILKNSKNVTIAKTRSIATQIPIHIRDQAIQTSLAYNNSHFGSFSVYEGYTDSSEFKTSAYISPSMSSDNSKFSGSSSGTNTQKRSAFVCYPSYSLPDLSFLQTLGKRQKENDLENAKRTDNFSTCTSVIMDPMNTEDKTISNLGNSEILSESDFSHIKDWDSLSILLPNGLKSVLPNYNQKTDNNLDHRCLDENGLHCSCSGIINRCCTEYVGNQTHKNREFTCSVASSTTTSSSRGSEHLHSDILGMQNKAARILRHLPKRSLSLMFEKGQYESNTSPRGILRKSSSAGHCNKQRSHDRRDVTCRGVSCQLNLKRCNQIDQYTQSLENIPEKLPQPENKTTYAKMTKSPLQNIDNKSLIETLPSQTNYNSGVINSPRETCTPENYRILINPVNKTLSDGHCPRDQVFGTNFPQLSQHNTQSASYICKNSTNTEHNNKWGSQCCSCSLNSLTSPIHQLCDQLQQLLNSSTSLNLMAAALLSTKGSPDAVNCCSISSQSSCFREKKSVTFHDESITKENNITSTSQESPRGEVNSEDDSDSPPQEFAVSPQQGSPSMFAQPIISSDMNNSPKPTDILDLYMNHKTGLLKNITVAVEQILNNQKEDESQREKVLKYLCPAIYNVLANGLLHSDDGSESPPYSPWKVAETSSRFGHSTKELEDLVVYVAGKECLTGHTCRFYIFILGLLNLGIIDWWFLHLTSCEPLIRQHYQSDALLSLLASPLATKLCEGLLIKLRSLSDLKFALDMTVTSSEMEKIAKDLLISTPLTEQEPLLLAKRPNLIQNLQCEPTAHEFSLDEEVIASPLRRSKKTNQLLNFIMDEPSRTYFDDKLLNSSPLKKNSLNCNVVKKENKNYNKSALEAVVGITPLQKRKPNTDKDHEIKPPKALDVDSAKDILQRAVDLAFPTTPIREKEADELRSLAAGNLSNNKIQDTDICFRKASTESLLEKQIERCKTESQNEQDDHLGNCFEELKRKWEQLTSLPSNDGKQQTTTVTTTVSKRPPLPLKSRSDSDKLGCRESTRVSRQATATTRVKKSLPASSNFQEISSNQQPSQNNTNFSKHIASRGNKEPVVGSAIRKTLTRTTSGPPNPTVKQVTTLNQFSNNSVKQKGVSSAPSSPIRKRNPRRTSDNLNSGISNSPTSTKHSTVKGGSEPRRPRSYPSQKSLIPTQKGNRMSSGQQKIATQHFPVSSSRS